MGFWLEDPQTLAFYSGFLPLCRTFSNLGFWFLAHGCAQLGLWLSTNAGSPRRCVVGALSAPPSRSLFAWAPAFGRLGGERLQPGSFRLRPAPVTLDQKNIHAYLCVYIYIDTYINKDVNNIVDSEKLKFGFRLIYAGGTSFVLGFEIRGRSHSKFLASTTISLSSVQTMALSMDPCPASPLRPGILILPLYNTCAEEGPILHTTSEDGREARSPYFGH